LQYGLSLEVIAACHFSSSSYISVLGETNERALNFSEPLAEIDEYKFMCILSNIMFNKNIYEIQFSTKLNIKALYAYRFCFYMYFSSMGLCGAVRVLRVCHRLAEDRPDSPLG
jgi:hypothetical protein